MRNTKNEYLVDDSLSKVKAPGMTTNYTYNGGTKVSTIKGVNQSNSTVIDLAYSYTPGEQISQITDKGQVKKKYTYSSNGFLETTEENGTKLQYSHDGNGNILQVVNLSTGKLKYDYTYGSNNQLSQKKEYNDTDGSLIRTTTYSFNANGALSKTVTTEGSNVTEKVYNYNG